MAIFSTPVFQLIHQTSERLRGRKPGGGIVVKTIILPHNIELPG